MCDRDHFITLESRVDGLEDRLCKVESAMSSGFASVNSNIESLSQQITNMDKRIIEEKVKWGSVQRRIVLWTVGTILSLALAAAGINSLPEIVRLFR